MELSTVSRSCQSYNCTAPQQRTCETCRETMFSRRKQKPSNRQKAISDTIIPLFGNILHFNHCYDNVTPIQYHKGFHGILHMSICGITGIYISMHMDHTVMTSYNHIHTCMYGSFKYTQHFKICWWNSQSFSFGFNNIIPPPHTYLSLKTVHMYTITMFLRKQ